MLDVDGAATFLLGRGLIDPGWIVDGALTIRSMARRNRNLLVLGPGGGGYLVKQPDDPAEGGHATLRSEAAFYEFCREGVGEPLLEGILPRLVDRDLEDSVLVIEFVPDARPLDAFLRAGGGGQEESRATGRALGTLHRTFQAPGLLSNPLLAWLPADEPWVMSVHRPSPGLLASLSPANHQTLQVLQSQPGLAGQIDRLRGRWRPETLIHGDVKFENVLARPPRTDPDPEPARAWLVDWELVQVGDPAWDVAGALQDYVHFWISSMPSSPGLTAEERIARAGFSQGRMGTCLRAFWNGYRSTASLSTADADDLLLRAVAFSAARLIQSAYEHSNEAERLSARSVILLQISANLLADPGRGRLDLYGIPQGPPRP